MDSLKISVPGVQGPLPVSTLLAWGAALVALYLVSPWLTRLLNRLLARMPRGAVGETLTIWALCFTGILVTYPFSGTLAKIVATCGFLYLPLLSMDRRGEDFPDYGITLRAWKKDLAYTLGVLAVVTPLFLGGYWAFAQALTMMPERVAQFISPYGTTYHFELRLPARFGEWVIDQFLVVALPEEFFYRGFIQTRLTDAWPDGRRVFGVRVGRAFFLTALLFALGHLAIFQFWRLGVFFPALIFGWVRERTGTVIGAAIVHAVFNLMMLVMEASFYGRG